MSPTTLLDEMIRRLEEERQRNPGACLLVAQEIVCDVVADHAQAEREAADRCGVALMASRVLDKGVR